MTGRRRLARGTVRYLLTTLSAIFREAVEDGLLLASPVAGLARIMKLGQDADPEDVEAFEQEQLVLFLVAARTVTPDLYPAFAVMGLAGLRVGEAMALKVEHVDLAGQRLRVREQLRGRLKTRHGRRDVDLSDALRDILGDLSASRREEAFREGHAVPSHVLFPEFDLSTDAQAEQRVVKRIRRGMQRVLKAAGLPAHHTPHSLRHTFAAVLVAEGYSPEYVRRQMGHHSIKVTVDVYGRWFPVKAPGAVNVLARGLPVTQTPQTGNAVSNAVAQTRPAQ